MTDSLWSMINKLIVERERKAWECADEWKKKCEKAEARAKVLELALSDLLPYCYESAKPKILKVLGRSE